MAQGAGDIAPNKRRDAGFLSSASQFALPIGSHVKPGSVHGYYIDLRIKPWTSEWPVPGREAPERTLFVDVIQWGLGCWEHYLAGEGEAWLAAARGAADALVAEQEREGPRAGGWVHLRAFRHTYALRPPWLSSMAQGEGASLLVRMYAETGQERYAEAARRALLPLAVDSADGGVRALLQGRPFPEEYPTSPPSFVLNGAMFAMWGLHDVGVGLGDGDALSNFQASVDMLASNIHRWDLGYWSQYDLFKHPLANISSSFYHDLHINQLRVMHQLAPRPALAAMADRWDADTRSAANRRRALAHKALFRLVVPRKGWLARRLPWSPLWGLPPEGATLDAGAPTEAV